MKVYFQTFKNVKSISLAMNKLNTIQFISQSQNDTFSDLVILGIKFVPYRENNNTL